MLYTLDDYVIIPSKTSKISSRTNCRAFYDTGYYPLITAPMSSVIDENNWVAFKCEGILTIIPRNVDIEKRLELSRQTFAAVSLDEFEHYFVDENSDSFKLHLQSYVYHICVDIANGHMERLLDLCYKAKAKSKDALCLMAGNIANPETYEEYAKVGIDYVRCSIGSGSACITASNSAVHYPIASLIQGCYEHKQYIESCFNKLSQHSYKSIPKIVADGGFQNFDQIIKAIALGADYVMLGNIFAKTFEACGPIIDGYREYYGMSTKRAQQEISDKADKTSEGISKKVKVEYHLDGWLENFDHYFRSAMSYCNSRNIDEFRKNAKLELISPLARLAYFK